MSDHTWPPVPTNQVQPDLKENSRPLMQIWWLCPGLLIGIFDITQTSGPMSDNVIAGTAFVLGVVQPKLAWLHALLIVTGLFAVHVVAIICGLRHPYVENNVMLSLECFYSLIPAFIFASLGAGSRFIFDVAVGNFYPNK
jgi:hypothetical protein